MPVNLPFNLTEGINNISNINTVRDFLVWTNNASQGAFAYMLLLSVFLILFITLSFSRKDHPSSTQDAFLGAGYVTWLVSILLWILQLIPAIVPLILIIVLALMTMLRR